jgi:hypothetical protein
VLKPYLFIALLYLLVALGRVGDVRAQGNKPVRKQPVSLDKQGHLIYAPDERENRIPDFSYCGYKAGEQAIPNADIKVVVPVRKGDATLRIQAAIDYVASLPVNSEGIRGAVLLEKGVYDVAGSLKNNGFGCGTSG